MTARALPTWCSPWSGRVTRASPSTPCPETVKDGRPAVSSVMSSARRAASAAVPTSRTRAFVTSAMAETTALGAAYLAGLAVGYWKDLAEIGARWQAGPRFEPRMPREQARELRERWKTAVERAKHWEKG